MSTTQRAPPPRPAPKRRPEAGERVRRGGIVLPAVSVRRLMLRFVLASLAGLVVLAAVTALVSRRVGTSEAIDEARRIGFISGKGVVEPAIRPGLLRGAERDIEQMDRLVQGTLLRGSAVRVKIWRADGRVVYSDERRLVGERFELGRGARQVLAGGPVQAQVTDLSESENRYEARGNPLLEVYTRIEAPSGEPLLFEQYFTYDSVTASGRRLWLAFAPVALGALLLLQLLQFPLAWSLARRLRRGQEERERLMRHAIESSDAERRRIAGELHDGTVQDLAGVSFALTAAARRAGGARDGSRHPIDPSTLTDAAGGVRAAIKSLRSLLVEIYPPDLEEEGLESALSDLVARLPARGVEPHIDVVLPAAALPSETLALTYRCAQEIVRNAVRHADATRVWLRVRPSEGGLRLEIEDDGHGFDPRAATDAQTAGHIGLRVLGDLVAEAGGDVELASAPGRGTIVIVQVPG